MRSIMNFGENGLSLTLPDSWDITVAAKRPMPVLPDPQKTLLDSLRAPVGCAPLAELARGKKSVCVVICDVTRPVPNKTLLTPLLAEVKAAGVPADAVTILVATGLHRPNEGEELLGVVGDQRIIDTYRVENHFATHRDEHVFFDPTPDGVPVGIDRRFADAELKIVVGLVEPHFMAGYSGGRKVVAPGVCHESTIRTFHNAHIMGDGAARNLNLEDNPLHRAQLHIIRTLAPVYAVNTVIDEERRPALANFGEIEASHAAAVAFAAPWFQAPCPRPFKTIITSCAGAPLDKTYYQTVKGLVGVKEVLEPGGRVFIVSECREGLGSEEFRHSQADLVRLGAKGFLEEIGKKSMAAIDEWQTQKLTEMLLLGSAVLYAPLLSPKDRAVTGIGHTDDLEASVAEWVAECGDTRVLVVPEGPYVIPVLA